MRSVSVDGWRSATMNLYQIQGCSRFVNQVCLPLPLTSTQFPPLSSIKLARMIYCWLIKQVNDLRGDREWPHRHDRYYPLHGLNQEGRIWGFHHFGSRMLHLARGPLGGWIWRYPKSMYFKFISHYLVRGLAGAVSERHEFRLRRWGSVVCDSRSIRSLLGGIPTSPQMATAKCLGSLVIEGYEEMYFRGGYLVLAEHALRPRAKAMGCGMSEAAL